MKKATKRKANTAKRAVSRKLAGAKKNMARVRTRVAASARSGLRKVKVKTTKAKRHAHEPNSIERFGASLKQNGFEDIGSVVKKIGGSIEQWTGTK